MGKARNLAERAKKASQSPAAFDDARLSASLEAMADALSTHEDRILSVNAGDVVAAREAKLADYLIERLTLNPKRILGMAEALREVAAMPSPLGKSEYESVRPGGLHIVRKKVPFGVVGVVYESRPNVTADAVGLCVKSGNAVLLRGGSEALATNLALMDALIEGACRAGLPDGWIGMIDDPDRAHVTEMMGLTGLIDLLIPRGGAGLIQNMVENAKVPVLQTGTGMCHVYVDRAADEAMAIDIVVNAKVSRPSVCNAAETLLIDEALVPDGFVARCAEALVKAGVELRGDAAACALSPTILPSREGEWDDEHLALILGVKIVGGLEEALAHIAAHGTQHSEAIVTNDPAAAEAFMQRVDAAAVYHNASTRFTDGGEFGMGAEIGISNQKLHARGPVGIEQLTTAKYFVHGSGHIRV